MASAPEIQQSVCRTRVAGRDEVVPLGQGVQVGDSWRNCVVYDGHPVIVHSTNPPDRAG